MKNLSIVGKFAALMAVFGVFTLGVATYSASQISKIDESYTDLLRHDSIAALALGKADKAFENGRAAIGDLLMLTDDALNAKAIKELKDAHDAFLGEMDRAIAAAPQEATLVDLKAAGLNVLDNVCKLTVQKSNGCDGPGGCHGLAGNIPPRLSATIPDIERQDQRSGKTARGPGGHQKP